MDLQFDHVGLITDEKKSDESWVEATRVWVTNPKKHPFHIEWLRFDKDTPVTGAVRTQPHVAYRVKNIEEAAEGLKLLLGPFEVGDVLRVGFYQFDDGAVVELMEYRGDAEQWI